MPLSGKQLVRMLKRNGWNLIRINGSHHVLEKGEKTLSVPIHGNKSLGKGLEQKLLKESGIEKP